MASQQVMMRETILAMTRKLAREKEGAHDSDNEPHSTTNRHNKLKRRAEFYHEGELGGRMPYKRKIEHAGYFRYILKRNPRRYDDEGYELESDDQDSEADREVEEKNPYSGIRIEETLGPLTHVKDLEHHPAMSLPYKSQALPSMIADTLNMVHRERRMLVNVKNLLEPLRGDQAWIPAGALLREDDAMLFGTELVENGIFRAVDPRPYRDGSAGDSPSQAAESDANGDSHKTANDDKEKDHKADQLSREAANGAPTEENANEAPAANTADTAMTDAPAAEADAPPTGAKDEAKPAEPSTHDAPEAEPDAAAAPSEPNAAPATDAADSTLNVPKSSNPPTPSAISSPTTSPPPRMLTRGRAAATTNGASRSTSPNANAADAAAAGARQASRSPTPPPLHPLYVTAQAAGPERDMGLPAAEAEELRRLLAAYAQKQEEVVRGANRLHAGLLKALRLRDTVWWWARAEPHRGDMSDNEDWVDLEEWRLDAPLRKGNETGVDEAAAEELAALGTKKTRGRRVAG